MIYLKTPTEIERMRESGKIVRDALLLADSIVRAGVTTAEINAAVEKLIRNAGAVPSFLNYNGFPASACVSVNGEVVHGIPGRRIIKDGDIVSVDVGAVKNGYHGDAARTFTVGAVKPEILKLVRVTEECFFKAVESFKDGGRLGDIGEAVQRHAEGNGFSVVRALVGHGIGRVMHEDPAVPNYGTAGHGIRLSKGLALAIEPMINLGSYDVRTLSDGWTVVTADGKPSSHYENTVVLTSNGTEILTL
ncbi:MAG: type I methionyl aminopeptidase [Clostridiaceae bacterium]|jgi:methionyl aminopeptidase|nr:type I methionyl aminopeptidase [Clostridiaceae bacterium]